MIISVAGGISSGKTTLAKKISALYGFTYVPQKRLELNFLDSFFKDVPGLFFPTQTSFLISKVLEIDEKRRDKNLVIDRSLFEDIHIFAQYWMEHYPVNENEKKLYTELANYLVSTVPKTDIYLLCRCEQKTALERYHSRKRRGFEDQYPSNYLQQLWSRYASVVFPGNAIVVEVDTTHLDVREDKTVMEIMSAIQYHIDNHEHEQMSLFDSLPEVNSIGILCPHVKLIQKPKNLIFTENMFRVQKKQIYLAAPFTEFATVAQDEEHGDQLTVSMQTKRAYQILPNDYQRTLKRIKSLISCNGEYEVVLPHEDENDWGKVYLSNHQIVDAMMTNLRSCDLMVAIVSNSIGVHMEMAMMGIQEKPMLLVIVDSLSAGFYAEGYQARKGVMVVHANTIPEVYKVLNQAPVKQFIRRQLSNEEMDREKL